MAEQSQIIWTGQELSLALGMEVKGDTFRHIQINSKDVAVGDIFIAMLGAHLDGHDFVQDALNRGAALAIVSRDIGYESEKVLQVIDCFIALENMARYKRANVKAQFIAITGSVGKTSLKEAAFAAFKACGESFCSRGNFNNKLGLLINLASMPSNVQYCILELGMNHKGEILELTQILKPNVAIINNIYNTHQANFATLEDIALAKAEILDGLDPNNGYALLPKDSDFYYLLKERTDALNIKNIYDFSTHANLNSTINLIKHTSSAITVKLQAQILQLQHNNLPQHQAANFLPVILTAFCFKMNLADIAKGLQSYNICSARGNLIECTTSDKKFHIIDDSYNSSPVPLAASLKSFDAISEACRKIAIIGDMLELGANEAEEHSKFVEILALSNIDIIITFGSLSKVIFDKLCGVKEVYHYSDLQDLELKLSKMIKDGDYFLIKASYSMNLKRIVTFLCNLQ